MSGGMRLPGVSIGEIKMWDFLHIGDVTVFLKSIWPYVLYAVIGVALLGCLTALAIITYILRASLGPSL